MTSPVQSIWVVVPLNYGHVVPTTSLASKLAAHGVKVRYVLVAFAATHTDDSPAVRLLEYLGIERQIVLLPSPVDGAVDCWAQQMADVWSRLGDTIEACDSPAVLYDRYVPQAALLARLLRIPAAALCTDLPNRIDLRVPPVNSAIVPGTRFSLARLLLAWSGLLLGSRRQARTAAAEVSVQGAFTTSMAHVAERYGDPSLRPPAAVSLPPYPVPRPPETDEFVFTSPAFDFRRTRLRSVHRLGLLIEDRRPHIEFPWDDLDPQRKLVYCAFGTERLEGGSHERAFQVVAEAAAGMPEYQVVLATGPSSAPAHVADNVIRCREAPQLPLIRRADVVISHGGFNTVKEAAAAGVPSLVLPVSGPVTDAGRTGALVEYLGLGAVLPEERLQVGRMTRLVRDLSRTAAVCRAYASNLVDSGPDPAEIVLARLR